MSYGPDVMRVVAWIRKSASVTASLVVVCCLLSIVGCVPGRPGPPISSHRTVKLAGFAFIGSVDTMKLSKDQAVKGFTATDTGALEAAASIAATHITVDTPLEYPAVMIAWANRIHAEGKHVWFRLASINGSRALGDASKNDNYQPPYDGYPGFGSGYLTALHHLMLANPGLIQPGDILDGDAEVENSTWWASNYGCGVQQECTPCPDITRMNSASRPCSPVSEFNRFLQVMTTQENADLISMGITPCATITSTDCVLTQVHSTDPGVGTHQLSNATVKAMGGLITIDAYPDQNTTDPATAANEWLNSLRSWHKTWQSRGLKITILVGEWGYSNAIDVGASKQEAVINAEVSRAFPNVPYLAGVNYWVGPGAAGDGGYTHIFYRDYFGFWHPRPAANVVSDFYAMMNGGPQPSRP